MNSLQILGFGKYIPEAVITNADLEKRINTNDEWIITRTGIHSRHQIAPSQQTSDMGFEASKLALEHANIKPETITHVLVATCTPDMVIPNTACLIAAKLGIISAMAFDINVACTGFVYALDVARALAVTNPDAHILLVAAESLTRRINWQDRGTCVLFGDGAGAFIVSSQGKSLATLTDILCCSDGTHASLLQLGCGNTKDFTIGDPIDESFFIQMEGRELFKAAVRSMTKISKELLEKNGLTIDDIDLFVPHQANLRIIEAVGQRLNIDPAKVFVNVGHMGNTSAASIPLALIEAYETGILHSDMRVLLTTFGGGFTWASALMEW